MSLNIKVDKSSDSGMFSITQVYSHLIYVSISTQFFFTTIASKRIIMYTVRLEIF